MKILQWQHVVMLSPVPVIRGVNKKCEFNGGLVYTLSLICSWNQDWQNLVPIYSSGGSQCIFSNTGLQGKFLWIYMATHFSSPLLLQTAVENCIITIHLFRDGTHSLQPLHSSFSWTLEELCKERSSNLDETEPTKENLLILNEMPHQGCFE